jgi:hypothetical protein
MGIIDRIFKHTHRNETKKDKEQSAAPAVPPSRNLSTPASVPIRMDAMTDEELVQDLTKDYAEVMDGIAEMLDLKRSLEKDLAASDDQIAFYKQKVQQPGDDAPALGDTLAQYMATRAHLGEALEKVNDALREMRLSIEKLNDVLRRLPGGYKRDWEQYNRVDIRTLPF